MLIAFSEALAAALSVHDSSNASNAGFKVKFRVSFFFSLVVNCHLFFLFTTSAFAFLSLVSRLRSYLLWLPCLRALRPRSYLSPELEFLNSIFS
jgi:hypothetical protein